MLVGVKGTQRIVCAYNKKHTNVLLLSSYIRVSHLSSYLHQRGVTIPSPSMSTTNSMSNNKLTIEKLTHTLALKVRTHWVFKYLLPSQLDPILIWLDYVIYLGN